MIRPGIFINDRYEIIDKLGAGGMADVYRAKCHRLNRFVAIKILKAEYNEDKKFIDKFRAEAQSVAGLSHPNIVNVYDVGEDENLYYIVMELVEGITLKQFIEKKGYLDQREATGIAIQIARGMEAAHQNHIIHRDIKPQNIIISREGKVKVTDFGIAKALTSNTITSNAMGSVYYISPEQARGGYSDEKSDIYSLGVTLYEMLTGQVPFSGENTVSVALSHIQEEPINVRTLNPEISPSLDRIVQKCMQKKPERRYISAVELIEDLKQSINNTNGDFVKLASTMVTDAPTITLSEEEISTIRSVSNRKTIEEVQEELEEEAELLMEDDDQSDVDPKLEKIMIGGGIVTAIILIVVIIVLIAKFFGAFDNIGKQNNQEDQNIGMEQEVNQNQQQQEPQIGTTVESENSEEENIQEEQEELEQEVTMKYVVGYSKEEAIRELDDLELNIIYEEEFSEIYEKNLVCKQSVAKNAKLKKGDTITLTISKGSQNVTVPPVVGKTQAEAEATIKASILNVSSYEREYSETVAEGKITRTIPSAGSSVLRNSNVIVYISKGPEVKLSTVPKLTGLTEAEALNKLKESGLTGSVNGTAHSSTVPEGQIIEQSHSYGVRVEVGTEITFKVSLGPEITYKYFGSITISDNPFMYEDEEGIISLVLTQDGRSWEVYNEICTYTDFPLMVSDIEGKSDSVGEITMYCDGSKIGTYSISFTKVE